MVPGALHPRSQRLGVSRPLAARAGVASTPSLVLIYWTKVPPRSSLVAESTHLDECGLL